MRVATWAPSQGGAGEGKQPCCVGVAGRGAELGAAALSAGFHQTSGAVAGSCCSTAMDAELLAVRSCFLEQRFACPCWAADRPSSPSCLSSFEKSLCVFSLWSININFSLCVGQRAPRASSDVFTVRSVSLHPSAESPQGKCG